MKFSKDHSGFSLIELIIVVAILAVMTGGIANFISYQMLGNTKTCANKLNAAIGSVRTNTMTKEYVPNAVDSTKEGIPYLYIYKTAQGIFTYETDEAYSGGYPNPSTIEGNRIASSNVEVIAYTPGGTQVKLDAGGIIKIGFKKSTGAFTDRVGVDFYDRITVNRSSFQYTINMVKETGRYFVTH